METTGSLVWPQIIYGDGGQSGFNVGNSAFRFNSFSGAFHDVNFQNGDPTKWVIASGPIAADRTGSVLRAHYCRSKSLCRRNDLPRLTECLANPGLGWQSGIPGSELS